MRRSRYGYSGYRGRRTFHDILKVVAIILAIVVVLMVAVLLWGQQFLVFTDRGLRWNLPFGGGEEPSSGDPGNISVVIDESGGQEDPEEEQPADFMRAV